MRAGPLSPAAQAASVLFEAKPRTLPANATTVPAKARAAVRTACAGRASCAAEKRRSAGLRAQRGSYI
jgi:hypothetical protein